MNELTDLEICKGIAEIEGISNPSCDGADIYANVGDDDLPVWERYNPLTDDALCFKLMIKYEIKVSTYYKIGDKIPYYGAETPDLEEVEARTPQKVVCLAILESQN